MQLFMPHDQGDHQQRHER
ncbi:hypothetical protein F6476_10015 [Pseudomonas umsongensis]|uniref:Uncharacterized protein n=1 Tax=Pseudomonas umsongensis TaxID=198618 RepID=A0AAE7A2X2_9PSED|nr:hypothetical protein [Pseudomonas umsongensis]QFG33977.1 hypothetical protein F6476_10015 [Pseudomonas umsongensis]QJC82479.1 hypothetical protein HGP31_12035 [Pseudomonas umsongensis]